MERRDRSGFAGGAFAHVRAPEARGLGALLSVLAVALLAPSIVFPFVSALAAPVLRLRGVSGQLAEENASRSARRTATTASASMIGTSMIAASLARRLHQHLDRRSHRPGSAG